MELSRLSQSTVLSDALVDVAATRERTRRGRVARIAAFLAVVAGWLWWRALTNQALRPDLPSVSIPPDYLFPLLLVLILGGVILVPMLGAGRSPHVTFHPSEIDTTIDDVKGIDTVRDEVVKTLNLFLAHKTFRDQMGGTPRRAILFEGPPGTGKTYMAKAMANEAGVPFLFVSSSAFQSMYYGQTNRKIRSYFKALRKAARKEGGAIGFIEEIDAIGASRRGMGSGGGEGVSGVVNELLIQLQSFDEPPFGTRFVNTFIDRLNRFVPSTRQISKKRAGAANILVVGATNRAADLDPGLLRPGRFDRSVYFGLPGRPGRREIIDFYLDRKAHAPELDDPERRDALSAMTMGYSPVMIEHLFDEALVWALRRGGDALNWDDVQQAKMTEELGLTEQTVYTEAERRTVATHEAGHATVAHLVGAGRKLEVLSIIKRRDSLGLLAHSDEEERFTQTRSEIEARIDIAFGGMVAEELWFGESGSGPSGDLTGATKAAATMVGALGMGDRLISFEAANMGNGADLVAKVLALDSARDATEEILQASKARVDELLDQNRDIVEALRDALLDREELIGTEIVDVIRRVRGSEQLVINLTEVAP
ncbi:MAG: AAA family ATPase [Actinomycetia bacterium]|nr:AAA family ATPase [Actinomycetes bacterium]MCP4959759.1 AAA family ATPase [Actinomycetes bacterium]